MIKYLLIAFITIFAALRIPFIIIGFIIEFVIIGPFQVGREKYNDFEEFMNEKCDRELKSRK